MNDTQRFLDDVVGYGKLAQLDDGSLASLALLSHPNQEELLKKIRGGLAGTILGTIAARVQTAELAPDGPRIVPFDTFFLPSWHRLYQALYYEQRWKKRPSDKILDIIVQEAKQWLPEKWKKVVTFVKRVAELEERPAGSVARTGPNNLPKRYSIPSIEWLVNGYLAARKFEREALGAEAEIEVYQRVMMHYAREHGYDFTEPKTWGIAPDVKVSWEPKDFKKKDKLWRPQAHPEVYPCVVDFFEGCIEPSDEMKQRLTAFGIPPGIVDLYRAAVAAEEKPLAGKNVLWRKRVRVERRMWPEFDSVLGGFPIVIRGLDTLFTTRDFVDEEIDYERRAKQVEGFLTEVIKKKLKKSDYTIHHCSPYPFAPKPEMVCLSGDGYALFFNACGLYVLPGSHHVPSGTTIYVDSRKIDMDAFQEVNKRWSGVH